MHVKYYFNDYNIIDSILILINNDHKYQENYIIVKLIQSMIPSRVFLQKFETLLQNTSLGAAKPKLSLILNNIFYDEIKPFQTKYFCLTTTDILGIEITVDLEDNQLIIGQMQFNNLVRIVLENQVIQAKFNNKCESDSNTSSSILNKIGIKEINVSLAFQPVAAYNKKKCSEQGTMIQNQTKVGQKLSDQNLNLNETQNQLQISFSHREPLLQQRQIQRLNQRERNILQQLEIQRQLSKEIERQKSRLRSKEKQLYKQPIYKENRQYGYNLLGPSNIQNIGLTIANDYKRILKQTYTPKQLQNIDNPKVHLAQHYNNPLYPIPNPNLGFNLNMSVNSNHTPGHSFNNLNTSSNSNLNPNSSRYLNPSQLPYNNESNSFINKRHSPSSSLKYNNSNSNSQYIKYSNSIKDVPLFNDTARSNEQNQSLESLAQQREKILGQLFCKFKPKK